MQIVELRFDINPVAKQRPRFVRSTGIAYTPKETKNFEKALSKMALAQYKGEILDQALYVEVDIFIRRPRSVKRKYPTVKPDKDNYIKSIYDALNGIVWVDDALIIKDAGGKYYSEGDPYIIVRVSALE